MMKWYRGDVSLHADGNLEKALSKITAVTHVMAFNNDMFFPVDDQEADRQMIRGAKLKVIDTLWAHFAMLCISEEDRLTIDQNLRDLLAEEA